MNDDRRPKLLIIDTKSRTTQMVRGDLTPQINRVIELDPEQIMGLNVQIALNGGYTVTVSYFKRKAKDTLVFANKAELMTAFGNLLKE